MAESNSPRLGLRRWSDSATDTFSRAELDGSFAALEDRAAIYLQGTRAARPAAGTVGRYYVVTGDSAANNGLIFYDNGTGWQQLAQVLEGITLYAAAAAGHNAVIQAIASQTGRLTRWNNSAGTEVAYVTPAGDAGFKATTVTTLAASDNASVGGTLTVTGATSLAGLTAGTANITSLRSTALRSDGAPKTQIDVGGFARLDGLIPPGFIAMFGGAAAPAGWVLCNGASYTTAAQPDLFAAIGYAYGGSAGNFNVPDLRDKFPLGATGGAGKVLGNSGGAHSKNITASHLPAHTHTMAHTHTINHGHTATSGTANVDHTHVITHGHTASAASKSVEHSHNISHGHSMTNAPTNIDHVHYWDTGNDSGAWGGHEHFYGQIVNRQVYQASGQTGATYEATQASTWGGGGHTHAGYTRGMNTNTSHSHANSVSDHSGSSGAMSANATHDHTITVANHTGSSGGMSANTTHSHTVAVADHAGSSSASSAANTGSTGAASPALDVTPAFAAVNYIIKL